MIRLEMSHSSLLHDPPKRCSMRDAGMNEEHIIMDIPNKNLLLARWCDSEIKQSIVEFSKGVE